MSPDARSMVPDSEHRPAPDWHFDKIASEMACEASKERMLSVVKRMPEQAVPDLSQIDWPRELAAFGELEFPTYYQQPFHSVPGGYLSEQAALGDRCAMEAIYQEAHPERSLGVRKELASLVPEGARVIVDFGGGTGDAASAVARRLPQAQVTSIDASPFMTIVARHQNAGVDNVAFERGFAESTGLDDASVDAVTITLVFHECPDTIKRDILAEAHRVLKPRGTIVLSDTPQDDLHDYRGFYEPYKDQWLVFDPDAFLKEAGFDTIEAHDVAPPLWSRVARKPA